MKRLRHPATDKAPAESNGEPYWWNKRPSIHMPRWASRIMLEITKVRVERLQDISPDDAVAEGRQADEPAQCVAEFATRWDSLHGKGAWDKNPWVWVLEFRLSPDLKNTHGHSVSQPK